ncbi:hypothetical protein C8F01DRAFT_1080212 [Mycena amicta]|nr:hypothetical protein C8F01DRAFT_1080212 [Mycena amicta]
MSSPRHIHGRSGFSPVFFSSALPILHCRQSAASAFAVLSSLPSCQGHSIAEEAELHLIAPSRFIDGLPLHTTILDPLYAPLASLPVSAGHARCYGLQTAVNSSDTGDSVVTMVTPYTDLSTHPVSHYGYSVALPVPADPPDALLHSCGIDGRCCSSPIDLTAIAVTVTGGIPSRHIVVSLGLPLPSPQRVPLGLWSRPPLLEVQSPQLNVGNLPPSQGAWSSFAWAQALFDQYVSTFRWIPILAGPRNMCFGAVFDTFERDYVLHSNPAASLTNYLSVLTVTFGDHPSGHLSEIVQYCSDGIAGRRIRVYLQARSEDLT